MALSSPSWRRLLAGVCRISSPPLPFSRLSAASAHHRPRYCENVGISEFLLGIGKGLESHAAKLETEIGDIDKLLVTRTLRLKKIGIPCKQRKLILNYAHKYRLGLWRPKVVKKKPEQT